MSVTENLIHKCLENDALAQQKLYQRHSALMYGVCMRFAKCKQEAEDILQEGFIKVFKHLKTFRNEGNLESWMRRIMINTAINFYKRKLPVFPDTDFERMESRRSDNNLVISRLTHEEILAHVQSLPRGYRMVFNLYVIEGYTHPEIAKMMDISVNTSKSQLSRAKVILKEKINRKERNHIMQSNYLPEMVVSY